jgi:hypothetical protein
MGRSKQSRPIKRRRVILEADDSVLAEEQTTLIEQQQLLLQDNHGDVGGEEELTKAIEFLRKTPPDQLEAAAAEATRLDLARNDRWIHLRLPKFSLPSSPTATNTIATVFNEKDSIEKVENSSNTTSNNKASPVNDKTTIDAVEHAATNTSESNTMFSSDVPSWSRGLGFARLASEDFVALQKLHQLIKDRINRKRSESDNGMLLSSSSSSNLEWASWSGSAEDPRKRAFGFLTGTWGYDPQIRNNRLDITMPKDNVEENAANNERKRNNRAMLVLEKSEVPKGVEKAIKNICRQFRTCLLSKEMDSRTIIDGAKRDQEYRFNLAQFLRYEYLIAAQPNLHSGRALLPGHLDDPRKDGFGVIIVTVGMEGTGTVLLRDAKGIHRGVAMRLEAGDAYMLSDRVRDACSHGVLADGFADNGRSNIPFSERESLNLRFGLHDLVPPSREGCESSPHLIPNSVVLRNWE